MPAPRNRLFLYVAPLIALACLYLAFARHDSQSQLLNALVVGGIFGTFFGHTAVAAAWAAFGPGPVLWRIPLSLVWLALLCISWESNLVRHTRGAQGAGGVMAICLFGEWLALQFQFWLLVWGGTRLVNVAEQERPRAQPLRQFSMAQLIVSMAIVAASIGVLRILAPAAQAGLARVGEWSIYRPLATLAYFMSVPLMLAIPLPRRSCAATIAAFLWIGFGICIQTSTITPLAIEGLPSIHLAATYVLMTCWILALALPVRRAGYRLLIPGWRWSHTAASCKVKS